ncbi:MAG: hypothetical protein ACLSAH_22480 [Bilophila wadsworthia]
MLESPLLALLGLSLSTKPGKPGKDAAPESDEKPDEEGGPEKGTGEEDE